MADSRFGPNTSCPWFPCILCTARFSLGKIKLFQGPVMRRNLKKYKRGLDDQTVLRWMLSILWPLSDHKGKPTDLRLVWKGDVRVAASSTPGRIWGRGLSCCWPQCLSTQSHSNKQHSRVRMPSSCQQCPLRLLPRDVTPSLISGTKVKSLLIRTVMLQQQCQPFT